MKKSIPLTHVCATGARPRGSSSREVTRAERGADDRSWTLRILKLEGSTCSNGSYSRRELRIWVEGSPESSWKEPKVKGILEASRMEPGVKGSSPLCCHDPVWCSLQSWLVVQLPGLHCRHLNEVSGKIDALIFPEGKSKTRITKNIPHFHKWFMHIKSYTGIYIHIFCVQVWTKWGQRGL